MDKGELSPEQARGLLDYWERINSVLRLEPEAAAIPAEITALLDGTVDRAACAGLLTIATRQYAKRQLTWFRSKSTFPPEDLTDVTSDHLDRIARRLGLS